MNIKIFISIIISCFFYLNATSQSIDSLACKKVEDTLKIIECYLNNIQSDPQLKRIAAADFLREITNIPYEGGVSFLGKESPAKSFYIKCKEWFIANKSKLVWDAKQEKILMKE